MREKRFLERLAGSPDWPVKTRLLITEDAGLLSDFKASSHFTGGDVELANL